MNENWVSYLSVAVAIRFSFVVNASPSTYIYLIAVSAAIKQTGSGQQVQISTDFLFFMVPASSTRGAM